MRVAGGLETRLLSVARWAPALRFGSVPYLRKSAGRNFLLPLKDILNNFLWEWEPFPAQFRMKELNYNATNVPVGMGTVPRCTTCELLM